MIAPAREFIEIDGSYGEGGGQILRTSLALSPLLGLPVHIYNIRSGRPKPGLQAQHLTAIHAAQSICDAEVRGAEFGSTELNFVPGCLRGGEFNFDVAQTRRSAGSVTLVLQAVLLPLVFAPVRSRLILKGGTHIPFSPIFDYLTRVLFPRLDRMGIRMKAELRRAGYYPVGGGEIEIQIEPSTKILIPSSLKERGKLLELEIISCVSNLPRSVAERQLKGAKQVLSGQSAPIRTEIIQPQANSPGTATLVLAKFQNSVAGFSSLGEKGKSAEKVGEEAAKEALAFLKTAALLDCHLADQLIPFLALSDGEFCLRLQKPLNHLITNIWVVQQFAKVDIALEESRTANDAIWILKGKGIGFEKI